MRNKLKNSDQISEDEIQDIVEKINAFKNSINEAKRKKNEEEDPELELDKEVEEEEDEDPEVEKAKKDVAEARRKLREARRKMSEEDDDEDKKKEVEEEDDDEIEKAEKEVKEARRRLKEARQRVREEEDDDEKKKEVEEEDDEEEKKIDKEVKEARRRLKEAKRKAGVKEEDDLEVKVTDKVDNDNVEVKNSEKDVGVDEEDDDEDKLKESIDSIFAGGQITEEFKDVASAMIEVQIAEQVSKRYNKLKRKFNRQLDEAQQLVAEKTNDLVDGYTDYIVEKWMSENQVAVESNLKAQMLESLINNLRHVFESHNIAIDENGSAKIDQLEKDLKEVRDELNTVVQENVMQKKYIRYVEKTNAIREACEGLDAVSAEKFETLAEELSFVNADSFKKKLAVVRENYFDGQTPMKSGKPRINKPLAENTNAVTSDTAKYLSDM